MRVVMGVDPGLSGGYAILGDAPPLVSAFPRAGKGLDLAQLAADWRAMAPDIAVVEAVHSMPKQGVASSFSFGRGLGNLEGIMAALGIRYEFVSPQAWKKVVLAGTEKDKAAAIAWCRRSYPMTSLILPGCRVAHDGMADALCLAEFGRRTYLRAAA